MKSIITLICTIALCTVTWGCPKCNNTPTNNTNKTKHIERVDAMCLWNGRIKVVELYIIRGHEYIIVRAGTTDGGVHIIHAESCPCKIKSTTH